ncbi:MAG: hypothetical protein ACLPID_11355 [Beijerinckiaceae bacterium]
MILTHHDLKIELDDAWWAEAGMANFVPSERAFRPDLAAAKGEAVFEARIDEVGPLRRNPGVGIFNDNEEATARERVVRILKGFRDGAAIPPVILVEDTSGGVFRYKIGHGSHRFYCSLAAGFSHVPAIEGIDFTAQYL